MPVSSIVDFKGSSYQHAWKVGPSSRHPRLRRERQAAGLQPRHGSGRPSSSRGRVYIAAAALWARDSRCCYHCVGVAEAEAEAGIPEGGAVCFDDGSRGGRLLGGHMRGLAGGVVVGKTWWVLRIKDRNSTVREGRVGAILFLLNKKKKRRRRDSYYSFEWVDRTNARCRRVCLLAERTKAYGKQPLTPSVNPPPPTHINKTVPPDIARPRPIHHPKSAPVQSSPVQSVNIESYLAHLPHSNLPTQHFSSKPTHPSIHPSPKPQHLLPSPPTNLNLQSASIDPSIHWNIPPQTAWTPERAFCSGKQYCIVLYSTVTCL